MDAVARLSGLAVCIETMPLLKLSGSRDEELQTRLGLLSDYHRVGDGLRAFKALPAIVRRAFWAVELLPGGDGQLRQHVSPEDAAALEALASMARERCQRAADPSTELDAVLDAADVPDIGYLRDADVEPVSEHEKRLNEQATKLAAGLPQDAGTPAPIMTHRDAHQPSLRSGGPPGRPGKRQQPANAVRVTRPAGDHDWSDLGNDDDAIRAAAEALVAKGWTLAQLVAPTKPGRPSVDERERHRALATVVTKLRARGATLEAIGRVIGRDKRRVHELERRAA